jgi:hypothetical protein
VVAGGAAAALEHLVLHSDRHGIWGLGSIVLDGLVFLVVYGCALRLAAPTTFQDVAGLAAAAWRRVSPARSTS